MLNIVVFENIQFYPKKRISDKTGLLNLISAKKKFTLKLNDLFKI